MPTVVITRNRDSISEQAILRLLEKNRIEEIVAPAMGYPGHPCTVENVDVHLQDPSTLKTTSKFDLEILVLARDYPERQANLQERTEQIRNGLRSLLPEKVKGSVCVRLAPSGYAEF